MDIMANPDKPWSWYSISGNPNITFDMVVNNPDKPWDWYSMSRNKFRQHEKFN